MVDEEVDDVFKDFKFEDDEPSHGEIKKQVQKEFDKQQTREPERVVEQKKPEEIFRERVARREGKSFKEEAIKPRESEERVRQVKPEPEVKYVSKPGPGSMERAVLIGIIVILSFFIIFDLAFIHKGRVVETVEESKAVGMVVSEVNESEENKTVEEKVVEENETTKTEEEEEKELSGTIDLKINKIYKRKVSSDLGYITKISFTIENGKDKILKPVVRVYAYDKSSKDTYMDWVRGTFNYTIGIMPGDEQTGSIDLTPKTFTALNIIKTVVLKLYDEDDEIIASTMEKFYIE